MDGFNTTSFPSWQQFPPSAQQGANHFESNEIQGARTQVIESITRLSSNLRNAADICDNFVRVVARSNPVAVAGILGQSITNPAGRQNDLNSLFAGGANFLNSGSPPNPMQAPGQPQQPTTGPSSSANVMATGPGGQTLPPGLGPDDVDANGKKLSKRQKKLMRKARDPDAPKRPPSAYLLFQNEVRADMRERFPDMPYKEILGKVSEAWKNLSDGDRKIYHDKTNEEMKRWTVEKKDHEAIGMSYSDDAEDEYATSAALLTAAGAGSQHSNASATGQSNNASSQRGNNGSSSLAPAMGSSGNADVSATPENVSSKKRKEGSSSKKEKRAKH